MFHKIINKGVLDALRSIPDNSVDFIMTSPPYYGLRDYSRITSVQGATIEEVMGLAQTALSEWKAKLTPVQAERLYISPPIYSKKRKVWTASVRYDTTDIWGGDQKCEHDFQGMGDASLQHENRNNQTGAQQDVASSDSPTTFIRVARHNKLRERWTDTTTVGNNKNPAIFSDPNVTYFICRKCGAYRGQLGLEPTYDLFVEHLLMVTAELYRVLKPTGTLWWNMGDTYAGSMGKRSGYTDRGNLSDEDDEDAMDNGTALDIDFDYRNISPKSLMMIPERLATAMIDRQGWILRNKIIWRKPNGMPSSVKDRLGNKYEYIYFFTKSRKYYFNLDRIRKPLSDSTLKELRSIYQGQATKDYDSEDVQNPSDVKRRILDGLGISAIRESSQRMLDSFFDTGVNKDRKLDYDSKYVDESINEAPLLNRTELWQTRSRELADMLFPHNGDARQRFINYVHDHGFPAGTTDDDIIRYFTSSEYEGKILPEDAESMGSPRARELRDFFNLKGQGGNYDYGGLNSRDGSHYNKNGVNPGDVIDAPPYHPKGDENIHGMRLPPQPNQPHAFHPNGSNPGDVVDPQAQYAEWYFTKRERQSWHDHSDDLGGGMHQKRGIPMDHLPHPYGKHPDDVFDGNYVLDQNLFDQYISWLERYRPDLLMDQVFDIVTVPHPFAHFAVYPKTLVRPFMLAGCPDRVCAKCGKPYVPNVTNRFANLENKGDPLVATCQCNAGFKEAVVLDPFSGSGTTAVVGKELGHSTISVEIQPSYVTIIKERMMWGNPLSQAEWHMVVDGGN